MLDWDIVTLYLVFIASSFCSPLLPTRVEFVGIIGPLFQPPNEAFEVSTSALLSLAIRTSLALVVPTILAGPAVLDLEDVCQVCVHDHRLGRRGLSLAVILILRHGRVHFVVESLLLMVWELCRG